MKTKITNISKLYTWNIEKNILDVKFNQELLIKDNIIVDISNKVGYAENVIDAKNKIITPGFIDSHTHPIFTGNRSKEFILRSSGLSYNQISSRGGGILSTVKSLQSSNYKQLYDSSYKNILPFIHNGSTTIEAKSGYGLTLKDEIKSLEVIKELNNKLDIDIIPTFLGAHDFPEKFLSNKEKYLDLICNEMIPEIAEKKLAKFCDVFCEEGYFSFEQSKRILKTAKKYQLFPRLHADEFTYSKASELAAEVGAFSADHLMSINNHGIKALSSSNVIATLLPGTTFFLNKGKYADGRNLIDNGCRVAIATDFNPGTCTIRSLSFIMFLAISKCGLTLEESFLALTYNAATSLGIESKVGLLKQGYKADIISWNLDSIDEIPYWIDENKSNKINCILKNGKIIN